MNLGTNSENGLGITQAVASLPPDQMFELLKRMKLLIDENPSNARTMLNSNPQLAYALLQAQVIMRIVDPEMVLTMLTNPPEMQPQPKPNLQPVPAQAAPGHPSGPPPPATRPAWDDGFRSGGLPPPGPPALGMGGLGPAMGRGHMPPMGQMGPMMGEQHMMAPGHLDRMGPNAMGEAYHRSARPPMNVAPGAFDRAPHGEMMMHVQAPTRDPREAAGPSGRDPRSRDPRDRGGGGGAAARGIPPPAFAPHLAVPDPEKAQLIMQVLKLTDEQIAMLPFDQRQSIMELKKTIHPH